MDENDFKVMGVPLNRIRNRNERRVAALMADVLEEFADFKPNYLDIQDIFALALNNLPPRYAQAGSIILNEPLTDEEIRRELRYAVERVETRPTAKRD